MRKVTVRKDQELRWRLNGMNVLVIQHGELSRSTCAKCFLHEN